MFVCTFLAVAATLSFHDLQNAEGRTDQSVISSGVSMTRNIDQSNNVFHDDDDDLDKLSTKVNIDQDELPLLSRIRILLTEKRDRIFPLFLIISGSFTSLISVGGIRRENFQLICFYCRDTDSIS